MFCNQFCWIRRFSKAVTVFVTLQIFECSSSSSCLMFDSHKCRRNVASIFNPKSYTKFEMMMRLWWCVFKPMAVGAPDSQQIPYPSFLRSARSKPKDNSHVSEMCSTMMPMKEWQFYQLSHCCMPDCKFPENITDPKHLMPLTFFICLIEDRDK